MKTESGIRQDLYNYIKTTEIFKSVKGRLFKYEEERPDSDTTEDIVIAPLTETPITDIQEVVVMIRVYVADLFDSTNNQYRANGIRIDELEKLCRNNFLVFRTDDARCSLESIKTFKVDAKKEHCIVSRLNYKYCNY